MMPADIIDSMLPSEEGITVLGGEPFDQKEGVADLVEKAWSKGLSTVVFSGYTMEHLKALHDEHVDRVLKYTDVLIDGPFDKTQLPAHLPLIGSANQRFRFISDRYSLEDFLQNKLEIRVKKDGTVSINGMANSNIIQKIKSYKE